MSHLILWPTHASRSKFKRQMYNSVVLWYFFFLLAMEGFRPQVDVVPMGKLSIHPCNFFVQSSVSVFQLTLSRIHTYIFTLNKHVWCSYQQTSLWRKYYMRSTVKYIFFLDQYTFNNVTLTRLWLKVRWAFPVLYFFCFSLRASFVQWKCSNWKCCLCVEVEYSCNLM